MISSAQTIVTQQGLRNRKFFAARAGIALLALLLPLTGFSASPRINYLLHCSGCHLPGGEGNPPNVPTLHQELGRMLSVPAMRTYLVRVPGAAYSPLSDAELADVANWILLQFNAETLPSGFEPLSADEVNSARSDTLANPLEYRIEHWKNYSK